MYNCYTITIQPSTCTISIQLLYNPPNVQLVYNYYTTLQMYNWYTITIQPSKCTISKQLLYNPPNVQCIVWGTGIVTQKVKKRNITVYIFL
jgi:hypothetical protein